MSSASREYISDHNLLMLNGSNYAWWKPRALQALDRRRLGYIIDEDDEIENIDPWHARLDSRQARSLLLTMVPAEYFDSLQELKTPQLIWQTLEERFSVDRIDKKYIADQFYFLRYDLNLTIGQYIAKINNYAQQLKDIKGNVDDYACLHVLTKGLPTSFNNIVETIDNTKDISYADACAMLLKKELSIKKGDNDKNFNSGTFIQRARGRGRGRGRGGPLPDSFICRNCGGRGHYQSACPTPVKQQNQNSNQSTQQNNQQTQLDNNKKKVQFYDGCGGYSNRGRGRYNQSWFNSTANAAGYEQYEQQEYFASMVVYDNDEDPTDSLDEEYTFHVSTELGNMHTKHKASHKTVRHESKTPKGAKNSTGFIGL